MASRLGLLQLPRQVLQDASGAHVLPGNDLLPEHGGMVITRCLREWACLLPLGVGFATTQRLLGWLTHEPKVISTSQVRCLVREHAGEIRAAEAAEVDELLAHPERLAGARAKLLAVGEPRRKAAWPKEMAGVVEAALAAEEATPPEGVTRADWARVVEARREAPESVEVAVLQRLGPEVAPGEIVVCGDEVLVRQPKPGKFHEIRTAVVRTTEGVRYLSGTQEGFLKLLLVTLLLCGGHHQAVTFLADGARWIREFVVGQRQLLPQMTLILDWFHLAKRCRELTSMIGKDRASRRALYQEVRKRLWKGEVAEALGYLDAYRPQAQNEGRLEELKAYLESREESLVNYQARRQKREYIGSGGVEKANDVIVARRMKRKGSHWSGETADGMAALKTLWLNQGWDLYWSRREVLRLAAP